MKRFENCKQNLKCCKLKKKLPSNPCKAPLINETLKKKWRGRGQGGSLHCSLIREINEINNHSNFSKGDNIRMFINIFVISNRRPLKKC